MNFKHILMPKEISANVLSQKSNSYLTFLTYVSYDIFFWSTNIGSTFTGLVSCHSLFPVFSAAQKFSSSTSKLPEIFLLNGTKDCRKGLKSRLFRAEKPSGNTEFVFLVEDWRTLRLFLSMKLTFYLYYFGCLQTSLIAYKSTSFLFSECY